MQWDLIQRCTKITPNVSLNEIMLKNNTKTLENVHLLINRYYMTYIYYMVSAIVYVESRLTLSTLDLANCSMLITVLHSVSLICSTRELNLAILIFQ